MNSLTPDAILTTNTDQIHVCTENSAYASKSIGNECDLKVKNSVNSGTNIEKHFF